MKNLSPRSLLLGKKFVPSSPFYLPLTPSALALSVIQTLQLTTNRENKSPDYDIVSDPHFSGQQLDRDTVLCG